MARPFAIAKLKGFFGEDFDYCKVHDKRIELMDKFISENGIESKPGAAEFLGFLKQNGYRVAIHNAGDSQIQVTGFLRDDLTGTSV